MRILRLNIRESDAISFSVMRGAFIIRVRPNAIASIVGST